MPINPALLPQLMKETPNALITTVNRRYGMYGSGSLAFWENYRGMIYQDSVARNAPAGNLQRENGVYPLLVGGKRNVIPKGNQEGRDRTTTIAEIVAGPVRPRRFDSGAHPVEIRDGFDPTSQIRNLILGQLNQWGEELPQEVCLSLLVNGTVPGDATARTAYDSLPLFSAVHPVNPTDKTVTNPITGLTTYSNKITLASAMDETEWWKLKDEIKHIPDWSGRRLVHAGMRRCKVMVATEVQAYRWIKFIGGPGAEGRFFLQMVKDAAGNGVGVSSVSIGDCDIVVDPYLEVFATDKAAIKKRSFVIPDTTGTVGLPQPIIYAEDQPPQIQDSGEKGHLAYENKVREFVTDARVDACIGEPRGIVEVIEP